MPVQPTYPGVYIEELPSGVRTITGVATSITAFIGRAKRGPVNDPVTINSLGDFERSFGGLWIGSSLGYAVRDFYLNGGSQAIIVRVVKGGVRAALTVNAPTSPPSSPPSGVVFLTLEAASEGTWANGMTAAVDSNVSADVAKSFNVSQSDLFNLKVTDPSGAVEIFRNLTLVDSPRRIDKVLATQSQLVHWKGAVPPLSVPVPSSPVTGTALGGDDGQGLTSLEIVDPVAGKTAKTGLYALEKADLFNLLCIPPYSATGDVDLSIVTAAGDYCKQRRAMLIVDPPSTWTTKALATSGIASGVGTTSQNAALFFPRLRQPDPLHDNQMDDFAPCGAVAGVFARTDAQRGVWKAPAGLDATLVGVPALSVPLTDGENGELNPLGVNCLRVRPAAGPVVWGSRTLQGDDRLASEWKYIPVRRLALFLEESLYRGTQWVVFEPNDEPLWAQIRLNLGAFMHTLFRQGAFQGTSPRDAYLVKCDKETTTQNDINNGVVNILVGFAPLKPAEFVIIQIQQLAGQVQT
jgi:phage tail sheath protein FI